MGSVDFTIHTPGTGTLSYMISSPLENSAHFQQLMPFTIFPVFVPPGTCTHHCWVDKGSILWEVLSNTSTHELTSVICWELVNLPCATMWVDERMDGWTDRLRDGLADWWLDGWIKTWWNKSDQLHQLVNNQPHSVQLGSKILDSDHE